MRSHLLASFLALGCVLVAGAQDDVPAQKTEPPQTARQALLEMLTSTKPGAFEKHLPQSARKVLLKGGNATRSVILREFTSARVGLAGGDEKLKTFDSGPILLSKDEYGERRSELTVERDDLLGDEDVIELSVRMYHRGEVEPLPVRPRFIVSMKQEKEIWTVNEITVAVHVPLADPDYLKDLQTMQNQESEKLAITYVQMLLTAEMSYNQENPSRGYTCKISDLAAMQNKPTQQARPFFIDSDLASGKKNGYLFSLGGCDGAPPSSKFHITATPSDSDSGMKTYCATESGVIRSIAQGNADACLTDGGPLDLP